MEVTKETPWRTIMVTSSFNGISSDQLWNWVVVGEVILRYHPPPPPPPFYSKARIFKRLWSPGIDSKEWIPPAYVAWRAGTIPYSNSVPSPYRLFKNSNSGFWTHISKHLGFLLHCGLWCTQGKLAPLLHTSPASTSLQVWHTQSRITIIMGIFSDGKPHLDL